MARPSLVLVTAVTACLLTACSRSDQQQVKQDLRKAKEEIKQDIGEASRALKTGRAGEKVREAGREIKQDLKKAKDKVDREISKD